MIRSLLICLIAAAVMTVSAQTSTVDPTLPPEHGSAALGVNFAPDPFRGQRLIGGGEIEINRSAAGEACTGLTGAAPDFRLTLAGDLPFLRLIFVADVVLADPTMLVILPDGARHCGDNAFGVLSPVIDLTNANAGDYLIWIGAHSTEPVYGSLYATRRDDVYPNSTSVVVPLVRETAVPSDQATPTLIPGTYLDAAAEPRYGSITLSGGFLPDPYWTFAGAGGSLDVPAYDLQADIENITFGSEVGGGSLGASGTGECAGFTTPEPALTLDWSGRSTRLRIFFTAVTTGEANTSLIIQAPDLSWWCSRDFAPGFTDPLIEFPNPAAGRYTIWVANEITRGASIPGAIHISERSALTPDGITLEATAPASTPLIGFSEGSFAAESLRDPLTVAFTAGGLIEAALNNPTTGCVGYYADTPALTLELTESQPFLRAFVVAPDPAEADPTLIAAMPDGQWYCADDWNGTTLPMITVFGGTGTGLARFWVGSYHAEQQFTGTLVISERGITPADAF